MKIAAVILLIAGMLLSANESSASTIRVPGDQPTIQQGIDAAADRDTVLVSPGTYFENINFRGKKIVLTSRFVESGDQAFIFSTIINGSQPSHADTASCVLIVNHEDSTTVLQGFTLTGGTGTKWIDEHGAGTYVEGGGILIQYASPIVRFNRIVNNSAIRTGSGVTSAGGGGIRVGDGVPRILNNVITGNAGMYGGGIVLNYTGGIVMNNAVAANRVYQAVAGAPTFGGGGIWVYQNFGAAQKIIENNTIVDNTVGGGGGSASQGRGGGILVGATTAIVRNNILWGNTQVLGGTVGVNSGGTANVTYSDVQGGFAGMGNIDLDPRLDTTALFLTPGSPCIDAGDTSAALNDPEDQAHAPQAEWPSRGNVRNDMGTYGGSARSVLPLSVGPTGVSHGSMLVPPAQFRLDQNYPNPFNPETTISYALLQSSFVSLTIHDALGREIETLVKEYQHPGEHSIRFTGHRLSSGAYFLRLSAAGFVGVRRCVLLK